MPEASDARWDLIIRNGLVVDGTGALGRIADVAVAGDRIAAIEPRLAGTAAQEIDATGHVVSPGFIDIHTHYDAQLFWDPTLSPSSCHGVTSVIAGNCGFSIAPLGAAAEDRAYIQKMLARVEGIPLESLREGVPWDWTSFGEYLERAGSRLAINAGFLVGHSALRRAVMGNRAVGGDPTPADLDAMKALLATSLAEGGLGFSTTISQTHNDGDGQPVPSRHARKEELVALAAEVGKVEGTFLEMVAEMGHAFSEETLDLMATMSSTAGRAMNWNLLNANSVNPDLFEAQLAASDYVAARGGRLFALAAPKPITLVVTFAAGMNIDAFPGWQDVMTLPHEARKIGLADPANRKRMNDEMHSPRAGGFGPQADWSRWRIVETMLPGNKALDGMLIGSLASRLDKSPLDTLLDLAIAEDLQTRFSPYLGGEDDESWKLRGRAWRDHRALIGGSDAGAHLDMIDTFAFSSHVLSEGVRDRKIMPLEEAVHRMTGLPAAVFGLRDRGVLSKDHHADIVIFDPATIGAGPLYSRFDLPGGEARLYSDPIGIRDVIVNGTPIIAEGESTGAVPGRVLRSGRDTRTVAIA